MIAYIAGKISGDEKYKTKFDEAEACLRGQGYKVFNPTCLPPDMPYETLMNIGRAMIAESDTVFFLPDWVSSEGAGRELLAAGDMRKEIVFLEDMHA